MRALAQTERLWEAHGELQIDIDSKKANGFQNFPLSMHMNELPTALTQFYLQLVSS